MSEYRPDKWVVVKVENYYKLLASWSGGYLDGDSWRMNSGIKEIKETEDYYDFIGYSGSCYRCTKGTYGTTSYTTAVFENMKSKAEAVGKSLEILSEDIDFQKLDYNGEQE